VKLTSPLRYPGGKGSLAGFLENVIALNGMEGCPYFEPYAGGAGAALLLLGRNIVSEVFINDLDDRVHAFWQSVLDDSERFVEKTLSVPLTINEWRKQAEVCRSPKTHDKFEVGFAAFYMNRCNRSGVLTGAGPIGGYEQAGKWQLDVRFNREPLAERILFLSLMRERIHLTHLDALDFLRKHVPKGRGRAKAFVYIDPPYVVKGNRLYLNAYDEDNHSTLARYLQDQKALRWLMSYDDTVFIRKHYSTKRLSKLPIKYSLQSKRNAQELLISPENLFIPSSHGVRKLKNTILK
jgi:DNA adenine methylase